MPVAVALEEVSCVFVSSGREVRAVDNVSMEIQEGEFFTLLGPSGSGKTTCLRMIGGFTLPTSGHIRIHGQDVSLLAPYARPVNTVFQDYALFPHMTIIDNVAYGLMVRGVQKSQRLHQAQKLLELVQLPDVAQRKPGQLSGGQRQRVALARVILKNAPILILDEATSALDSEIEAAIQEQLVTLMQGKTVIAIAHRLSTIARMDRLVVMDAGRIVEQGTHHELLALGGQYAKLWQRQSGGFLADDLEDQVAQAA